MHLFAFTNEMDRRSLRGNKLKGPIPSSIFQLTTINTLSVITITLLSVRTSLPSYPKAQ